jgi:hypothetical protein
MFSYYSADMIPSIWTKKEKEELRSFMQQRIDGRTTQDQAQTQIISESCWSEVSTIIKTKTPMECYMLYRNELDPNISTSPWADEESRALVELAAEYDEHDWVSIARSLGTHRTAAQCLKQYQQCLNFKLTKSSEWSEEELITLRNAVGIYGDHNWQNVASTLPGRSDNQAMAKWRKIRYDYKSGPWSELEEKRLFFACVALGAPTLASRQRSEAAIQALDACADDTQAAEIAQSKSETTRSASAIWIQLSRVLESRDEVC